MFVGREAGIRGVRKGRSGRKNAAFGDQPASVPASGKCPKSKDSKVLGRGGCDQLWRGDDCCLGQAAVLRRAFRPSLFLRLLRLSSFLYVTPSFVVVWFCCCFVARGENAESSGEFVNRPRQSVIR